MKPVTKKTKPAVKADGPAKQEMTPFQRCVKKLQELEKLAVETQDLFESLENQEQNTMGGFILATFSGPADLGKITSAGNTIIHKGLAHQISISVGRNNNPLARLFGED